MRRRIAAGLTILGLIAGTTAAAALGESTTTNPSAAAGQYCNPQANPNCNGPPNPPPPPRKH